MFGHQSQPSRVYSFGAKLNKEQEAVAQEILFSAHRYRNQLVELEHKRRAATDAALVAMCPELHQAEQDLAAAEEAVTAALDACSKSKVELQSKKSSPETADALKSAKAERKRLYEIRKELRAMLFASDAWKDEQARIDAEHRAAWKEARANCGLHCGTYLTVEQARGGDRAGAPPRFMRFDGCGRIAVQIQGGAPFADANDESGKKVGKYLQVNKATCPKSGKKWQQGRIRIGSTGNGGLTPVWLDFTTHIHREIPEDSAIKWAWLVAKRIAGKTKWKLQLVLARDEWGRKRQGLGTVAVNLGWKAHADGIRVAHWMGTDGAMGDIIIPNDQINRLRKCMDLQSIRSRNFDEVRERLGKMKGNAPEWFADATQHMHQWRSEARLAALILRWRNERWQGDEHAYALAEAWRKQDKHLWEWQANQRQGFQNYRKNLYRTIAAELSAQYEKCTIADIDWREFAKDSDEHKPTAAEEYRRAACVSSLSDSLTQAFTKDYMVEVDPSGIASECGNCGEPRPCECGASDDESRCLNLLRRSCSDADMAELFKQRSLTAILRATA